MSFASPALRKKRKNGVRAAYEVNIKTIIGERYDLPFDDLKQGRLLIGSRNEVIDEVIAYQQEFGVEFMWFIIDWRRPLNRMFGERCDSEDQASDASIFSTLTKVRQERTK